MKNIFKIATLFCLTVCVLLLMAACNTKDETPQTTTNEETTSPEITTPEETSEEDLYPEPVKQLLAENQPYSLEFTSNGDGTCYVSRLYLNNRYKTAFDIIIPEKSPAGDTVTGIDLGDSLTSPNDIVPRFLTQNQVNEILTQVKADYPDLENGDVDRWWINAYQKYDISKMSPLMAREYIKRYPMLEYMVIWNFYHKMSNTSDTFLRLKMTGITLSVAKQYYEDFMKEARDAGTPEEGLTIYKELLEAMPVYVNQSEYVRYLHIPSSVTNINAESLSCLMFEFEYDGECIDRGVVLPAFDLQTTNAIKRAFAASLPDEYDFVIFSQSTSSVGYEEIDNFAIYSPEESESNVLAWHYVDGVPTLW
ncbi:MAG: hypothetical protein IJV73_06385 [Clostridia bacterium]|nr:hypothetical protein [Clostridia bacterium]